MDSNPSLLRSSVQITIFSILNILINFVSQLVIAYYYGTSFERDAYLAAIVIPTYINAVFAGSIGFVFLTKYQEVERLDSKDQLNSFLSYLFLILFGLVLLIVLGGIFFSNSIIRLSVPGFNENQIVLTSKLLTIVLPTSLFFILSNILSSIYQIKSNFIRPALIPILIPFFSIVGVVLLTKKIGIYSLAYGFLIGNVVSFILLSNILKTIRFKFNLDRSDSFLFLMLKTSMPLFIFGFIFRFTPVFERFIASSLPNGSISYLGYANQILSILASITSGGIAVSFFPLMSKYWIEDKKYEVSELVIKATRIILLLTIPIAFIVFFWGDIIVKIFLERGAFDHVSTISVSLGLCMMMGALISQSLGNIIAKVFYFSGKTWTVSFIATIELIIYILLSYFLSNPLSYLGLALSTSISSIINILISIFYINKYLLVLNLKKIFQDTLKVVIISSVSFSLVFMVYKLNWLPSIIIVKLSISLIFGSFLFYLFGCVFKIEELLRINLIIVKKIKSFL